MRDYLVNFSLSTLPSIEVDTLVIGSGAAGLSAAISASRFGNVLLISKRKFDESASFHAQGGIAVSLSSFDSWADHYQDTLKVGNGLCKPEAVKVLVKEGQERVKNLIEWGANFDKEDGKFSFGLEGGHRKKRILHASGDQTGKEVTSVLLRKVRSIPEISLLEETFLTDLITEEERVIGALIGKEGKIKAILAKSIVLASGGIGQIYQETTNPDVSTGDGISTAYRAGATLSDMEFIQFHPTTLYVAGAPRFLISEAVRGEGGILLNEKKERFMEDYHPDGELAPRDIVSRAILEQIKKEKVNSVSLDVRNISSFEKKFPQISKVCKAYGLDGKKDLIPVRPTAHYFMGGVLSDLKGRTDLPGLFVCGESACTGVHGANRLASNSLLECLVFGKRAGETAGKEWKKIKPVRNKFLSGSLSYQKRLKTRRYIDFYDMKRSLKTLMWRNVGIEREGERLKEAQEKVSFWKGYALNIALREPTGWEIQNMLLLSSLIIKSALKRKESRGSHFRLDFPKTDNIKWKKHILVNKGST